MIWTAPGKRTRPSVKAYGVEYNRGTLAVVLLYGHRQHDVVYVGNIKHCHDTVFVGIHTLCY